MKTPLSLTVSFDPTANYLSLIDSWLCDELEQTGEGYKHNWQIILNAHKRQCMAILLEEGAPVGFAIWWELEFQIRLDIFCIEMSRRKQGLGNHFLGILMDEFMKKGKFAVELQCSPANSESYWRKHKFSDLPYQTRLGFGQNRWLYRAIVQPASLATQQIPGEYIALWDVDPATAKARNILSKWTWQVELKDGSRELVNPVVFPCQPDWQVQLVKDGVPMESVKAKYFNDQKAHSNKMLVIRSIPEDPK